MFCVLIFTYYLVFFLKIVHIRLIIIEVFFIMCLFLL